MTMPLTFTKRGSRSSLFESGLGNFHGKPDGEPYDHAKARRGDYTLRDGAMLVRMTAHQPHFCLYVYHPEGNWDQYCVVVNWWPRRKDLAKSWTWRIKNKKGGA